ncbi:MAG: patatin-like phospholipase family protein, partial [Lachnospiraceae bacterium]|nr:patatin-like phospholipase family protein [Lachnospiraceae bacterium]
IKDKGVDITPLKNMIADLCDEDVIRNSGMDFYIVTYSLSDRQRIDINAKDVPEGLIPDMLLASAYLPVFKREKLHGKHYMDGGGWDRVPIDSLLSRGYENIIVLRIFGWGIEKPVKIPGHVQIIDIAPRQDLGGILEFDAARSCRNIQLGYFDAKRALYGLAGEDYYLDLTLTEEEAYERLLPIGKKYLQSIYLRLEELRRKAEQKDSGNEAKKWIEEHLEPHIERTLEKLGEKKTDLRRIHEDILPEMARKLLKNRSWTYTDLYIKCLEQTASGYGISVFAIYTEEQLLEQISKKRELYMLEGEMLPEWDVLCYER